MSMFLGEQERKFCEKCDEVDDWPKRFKFCPECGTEFSDVPAYEPDYCDGDAISFSDFLQGRSADTDCRPAKFRDNGR